MENDPTVITCVRCRGQKHVSDFGSSNRITCPACGGVGTYLILVANRKLYRVVAEEERDVS